MENDERNCKSDKRAKQEIKMKKKKDEEAKGKATGKKATGKKDSMIWIIAAVIIIALVVLFFAFMSFDKGGDGGTDSLEEDIDSLDVGDNPDVGVEDFSSLEVSQEEVASN